MPQQPQQSPTSIRIPVDLKLYLRKKARKQRWTLSKLVLTILQAWARNEEKAPE